MNADTLVTITVIAAAAFATAVAVALMLRPKQAGAALSAATEAAAVFATAVAVARDLAAAAEQMARAGTLPAANRFDFVVERLAATFPRMDPENLRAAVEAAVFWINKIAPPAPTPPPTTATTGYMTTSTTPPAVTFTGTPGSAPPAA